MVWKILIQTGFALLTQASYNMGAVSGTRVKIFTELLSATIAINKLTEWLVVCPS